MAMFRKKQIIFFVIVFSALAIFLIYNMIPFETYHSIQLISVKPHVSQLSVVPDRAINKSGDVNRKGNSRLFSSNDLNRDIHFNRNDTDVIVFLEIQKTGTTIFNRHLVNDLEHPCDCIKDVERCKCFRPSPDGGIWLFSRYSVGTPCGAHPDWTTLHSSCIPQVINRVEERIRYRRYLYITNLRKPSARYLSEWRHVKRGATWGGSNFQHAKNICDGRLPFCYSGKNWSGVTLDEFIECKWNAANNRQTRMLANLSLVDCYNMPVSADDSNLLMLESAQQNLRRLAYFGLTEFQVESQYLFEQTFDMKFSVPFVQFNKTHSRKPSATPEQLDRIANVNALDIKLYEYAKTLFQQRLNFMRSNSIQ